MILCPYFLKLHLPSCDAVHEGGLARPSVSDDEDDLLVVDILDTFCADVRALLQDRHGLELFEISKIV